MTAEARDLLTPAVVAREPGAFEALVRREAGQLLATARRITASDADASDCVQETLLLAHSRLEQFDGRGPIAAWLHRILVNVALGKLRKRSRRSEISLDELMPVFDNRDCRLEPKGPPPPAADVLLELEETRGLVGDAIAMLPESHRTVLMLRDIEGRNTKDTAAVLGVSESATKVRLHRARAALKRLLEPVLIAQREELAR